MANPPGNHGNDPERTAPVEDVLLVHSPTEDGEGYHVLRKRGERLEAGSIRGLAEGKPLHGDVVRLSPREGASALYDVEVLHEQPSSQVSQPPPLPNHAGPARVATAAYRDGWDAIWGKDRRRTPVLN